MTCSLNESSGRSDSSSSSSYIYLPLFFGGVVQRLETHAAANCHSSTLILTYGEERLVECDILELMSPQEERVLCCGSSEEVMSRGLDGYPQVMLSCETNAVLLSSGKNFHMEQSPR